MSEKIEEEVLGKYKVEVSKRGAHKGRGQPLEKRMVQQVKTCQLGKWVKTAGREFLRWGIRFAARTRNAREPDGRGGDEAAAKDESHHRYDEKIRSMDTTDANSSWWVSELLASHSKKAWLHIGWEDTVLRWYSWLYDMKKKDEGTKVEVEHQSWSVI